jgi:predicted TIM-barrel fold metal-dependent hydrolase
VTLAVKEVDRAVSKGAKALAFSENPSVLGLPSVHTDYWDPLWKTIEDAAIPVCMHIGSSSRLITSSPEAPNAVHLTLIGANSMVAMADWFFSGALDRFPGIRVVLSEGGAGWVPYTLERAAHAWSLRGNRDWGQRLIANGVQRSPYEIFHDNFYVCMVKDDVALKLLDLIGTDRLMWESDSPHDDSLWPICRATFEKSMADVDDATAEAIGSGNASRVFSVTVSD